MKAIDEALARFGYDARLYYNSFEPQQRSDYCSYIGNHRLHNIQQPLMSPREWDSARLEKDITPTFDEIGRALGIGTAQHAYSCYKTGMR